MRTLTLKINVNNLREQIQRDYFKYRDLFYRCLVVNLCSTGRMTPQDLLSSTIIEDSHYNQHLLYLANSNLALQDMIKDLDPSENANLFIDTNIYFFEFFNSRHDPHRVNVYSLTIDDAYNIVITNKQLKRSCLIVA